MTPVDSSRRRRFGSRRVVNTRDDRFIKSRWIMARKHYQVRFRLDGVDSYLIWFSNDSDGVVVELDGSVPTFRARSDLCAYAGRRGLALEAEEPSEFDLDAVERWLTRSDPGAIECGLFLDAWNLFGDIASSKGCAAFEGASRSAVVVYDKLFWGNNLPTVTPPGEHFVPAWSDAEVAELHRILSNGMALVRDLGRVMS
jgi:hypothetical protein